MQTRTALVDSKLRIVEQKVPYAISAMNDYSSRCINNRMGGSVSGKNNGFKVSIKNEETKS